LAPLEVSALSEKKLFFDPPAHTKISTTADTHLSMAFAPISSTLGSAIVLTSSVSSNNKIMLTTLQPGMATLVLIHSMIGKKWGRFLALAHFKTRKRVLKQGH
jgi:hypothetical protein